MRNKGFPKRMPSLILGALLCLTVTATVLGEENPFKAQGGGSTNILHGPSKEGLISLDDLGISINATSFLSAKEDDDGFVYLYTQEDGYIPYMIIGKYDFVHENVVDQFTDYMKDCTEDFTVMEQKKDQKLGDHSFDWVVYSYTFSGYTIKDERYFTSLGDVTYMFGGKEVPELSQFLPKDYIRDVASSFALLTGQAQDYPEHVDASHPLHHEMEPGLESEAPAPGLNKAPGSDLLGRAQGKDSLEGAPALPDGPLDAPAGEPHGNVAEEGESFGAQKAAKGEAASPAEKNPKERELSSDTQRPVLEPISFKENLAPFMGSWVTIYDGLQVYLPTDWQELGISEFMLEKGILFQAGDTSGKSEEPAWIGVNYGPCGHVNNIEEMYDTLLDYGYTVEGILEVNTIPCISYEMESHNLRGLMFFLPGNSENVMALVAYNYSMNEDAQAAILCSLSPVKE